MEYSATLETCERYFEESFRQNLEYLGRFRRWQILIAALILAAAASWLIYEPDYFAGMLVFLGIGQIADFYRFRRGWINTYRRRFAEDSLSAITLTATESGLALRGLDDGVTAGWESVSKPQSTPKGLLVSIGETQPVFVPDSAINDRQFKPFVARKAANRDGKRASR